MGESQSQGAIGIGWRRPVPKSIRWLNILRDVAKALVPVIAGNAEHLFRDCAFFLPSTCHGAQSGAAWQPSRVAKGGSCNLGTWGNGDQGPSTDSALLLDSTTSSRAAQPPRVGNRAVQRSFSCPETSKAVRESIATALLCSQLTKELSTGGIPAWIPDFWRSKDSCPGISRMSLCKPKRPFADHGRKAAPWVDVSAWAYHG
eukprot:jgi/Botrbrau1/18866/Bobra.177_2s0026.1